MGTMEKRLTNKQYGVKTSYRGFLLPGRKRSKGNREKTQAEKVMEKWEGTLCSAL